jgi:FecR-like protein
MLRAAYRIGFAVVLLGSVSPAAFAVGIGTITDVVNQAYHTPPGGAEVTAKVNDGVVTDETLRTEDDSSISVLFVDGSELSVEAGSEVILSDYVFDAQTTASSGVIELNNGQFHFSSNGTDDSKVSLQTPVATIGIRGTEFLVTVGKDATVVDVVDGAVEVKPRGGGKAITCEGGQSILVDGGKSDAVCGDYGSFSTAAGVPPSTPPTQTANSQSNGLHGGSTPDHEPASGPKGGGKDPEPQGSDGNRSGHGDGSNPGKGDDHGHNNGGSDNPGGGKK